MNRSRRNRELAKIHVAKKQLGMDRETYEQMLWAVARVRSAGDLDAAGRAFVLSHLKSLGFKPRRPGRTTPAADKAALVRKIQALLGDRPEQYADGMARHMFGVTRYEWCDPAQLRKIIAALVYDKKRRAGRTDP